MNRTTTSDRMKAYEKDLGLELSLGRIVASVLLMVSALTVGVVGQGTADDSSPTVVHVAR